MSRTPWLYIIQQNHLGIVYLVVGTYTILVFIYYNDVNYVIIILDTDFLTNMSHNNVHLHANNINAFYLVADCFSDLKIG